MRHGILLQWPVPWFCIFFPFRTKRGLAVIDWEEWRPLWERNWGTKKIYQTLSLAHVMVTNRFLTERQATEKAKHQFQAWLIYNFLLTVLRSSDISSPFFFTICCRWQLGLGCQGCWEWPELWDPIIYGASICFQTATTMAGTRHYTQADALRRLWGRMMSWCGCGSLVQPYTPLYTCR